MKKFQKYTPTARWQGGRVVSALLKGGRDLVAKCAAPTALQKGAKPYRPAAGRSGPNGHIQRSPPRGPNGRIPYRPVFGR
jgi:hypothetical protein